MNRAQRRAQGRKGNSKSKVGLSVLAATSLVSGNVGLLTTGAAAAVCNVGDQLTLIEEAADLSCTVINVTADITFAEGAPAVINHDVTIQGDFTIDAAELSRIFVIENGFYRGTPNYDYVTGDLNGNGRIDVTIDGLTLYDGESNNRGGAIVGYYSYIEDGDYTETTSLPIDLTLNNVTISSSVGYEGGGLYLDRGNLTVTGTSSFTSNSAFYNGGAIYVNGDVTISGTSTFINNSTANNDGGAIFVDGDFTLSGTSNFTNNNADDGGAIYATDGTVSISGSSTFTGNSASNDGGAVYVGYGDVTLAGTSTFTANYADDEGGAIYINNGSMDITGNATFTSNEASNDGGAIAITYSYKTLEITAGATATFTSNDAYDDGGAVYVDGDVLIFGTATFTSNDAGLDTYSGEGGAIHGRESIVLGGATTFTGNTADEGGALFASEGVVFEGNAISTFTNNSAVNSGGAISTFQVLGEGDINVTFTGNEAENGNGGAIDVFGFQTWNNAKFSFINNTASNDGGAIATTFAGINSVYFGGNDAGQNGGAVFVYNNTGIQNSTFFENTAGDEGGAIFTVNNGSEVIFSTFVNNTAVGSDGDTPGQSIYTGGTFKLFGNIFASNISDLAQLGEGGMGTPEFQDLGGNLSTSEADAAELVSEASKIVTYAELTLAASPAVDPNYPNSTPTIQISTDSLAADAVDIAGLAESIALLNLAEGGLTDIDQRGAQRTLRYDAGAFEAGDSTYQVAAPVIDVAPKVVLPAAPNRVSVKSAGRGKLLIEWTQPSTAGTGKIIRYEIYRNGKKIATIASTKRSFRDTGLDTRESYTYRIVTVGTQGKSIKSVNSQSVFPRR